MEYITIQQAAEKWKVSVRRVQDLCGKGKVPGAVRFNRSWAIPKDVGKPRDSRYKIKHEERLKTLSDLFHHYVETKNFL